MPIKPNIKTQNQGLTKKIKINHHDQWKWFTCSFFYEKVNIFNEKIIFKMLIAWAVKFLFHFFRDRKSLQRSNETKIPVNSFEALFRLCLLNCTILLKAYIFHGTLDKNYKLLCSNKKLCSIWCHIWYR